MDKFVTFNECRLQNVRKVSVFQNEEVVGEKQVVDVVTWGDTYTCEVDPTYVKELKTGVTGRAVIIVDFTRKAEQKEYDNRKYIKQYFSVSFEKLASFESSQR
jgi:hypothetical protein